MTEEAIKIARAKAENGDRLTLQDALALYEDNDITYGFYEEGVDLDEFIKESHELVKTMTYTAKGAGSKVVTTPAKGTSGTNVKTKPKTDVGSEKQKITPGFGSGSYYGRGDEYMENYANDFYNPYYGR